MSDKLSKKDITDIANKELIPSGSRVMDGSSKTPRQIYPAPHKIIKDNIMEELGYDDDPLEEYREEDDEYE